MSGVWKYIQQMQSFPRAWQGKSKIGRQAVEVSFFFRMVKPESIYRLKKEQNRNSLQIEGKYRENDGSRNRDSRRWGPTWERDSSTSSEPRGYRLGAAQGGMDPWLGSLSPSCVAFLT